MRTCKKCSSTLPITQFAKNSRCANGYERQCATCKKAYGRSYAQKRRGSDPTYRSLTKNAAWLIEYKQTVSCCRCGENHPACLEFHHLEPTLKVAELSTMAKKPSKYSINDMEREIGKCIVLCANCHKKEHYNQYQNKMNALLVNSDS